MYNQDAPPAALAVVGALYFPKTAADLPGFFPRHLAHSATHHLKTEKLKEAVRSRGDD